MNVGIEGVAADALLAGMDLERVAVSAGSACHSGAAGGSHVLEALYGADDRFAAVRFSLGHDTTEAHVVRAADTLFQVARRLGATGEAA